MTDPYFSRPEISNSDLTSLKNELNPNQFEVDPTEAYAFGSLLDAMITEPHRINWIDGTFDGEPVPITFDKAKKMMFAWMNSDRCQQMTKGADFQKVSIKNQDFTYNGITFNLDTRCKWDFFGHLSGDIKSTSAKTEKQFIAACHHFDYFRSRAWYMDIENTDRDIIIGISKVNYKIFMVPISRGDDLYNKGKSEYLELAFKLWALR